ncbi:SRPBCC family protein [Janibacter alittae]|uniref:Carbon monoxide dehydrogenase subunit G n=1 Tax=Janibacter alittae TaxID=3115209 RepID=A0ABZ2MGF4_9MICO
MKISGSAQLAAPPEKVWDALLSPEVLVRTIPGCGRLEATGENSYALSVTAGVASIKGTYKGDVHLEDLNPHSSLTMRVNAAGSAGTIGVTVLVRFEPGEDGTTNLSYDADAVVGGMIGGVGQRMLTSVSKRLAAEFFTSVNKVLTGTETPAAVAAAAPTAPTPVADAALQQPGARAVAAPVASSSDLVKGFLLGAGVMLAGVVTGALAARRR